MMPTGWCPGARTIPAMLTLYPGSSAVRVFFAPGEGLPARAWSDPTMPARQRLTDLPAGCTVIVSFKDQLVDRAAFVDAWQQHRPDVLLILVPHHEPEQQTGGDPTRDQFRASWTRTREQVGAHPARQDGRLRLAVCYTLVWIRKGGDWRYWWPDHEADAVDLVLGDWYPYMPGEPNPWKPRTYEDPAAALKVITDISAATGKPWGIAEIDHTRITKANGYTVDLDVDGARCADWYRRMHAQAKASGCQVWTHYHYGHADGTTGDLTTRLPEQQALRELIAQEKPMSVLYADLSHHDWDRVKGEFDWAAIRKATSPVLCLRATYGDPSGYNPTTRHFADMALAARQAGFDTIGGYHNLIKGDQASINRQVDYLRRELDRVGATWAMLDVERYPELVTNGLYPRYEDAQQFCDRWRVVDDRPLLVYLPRWIWDGHMGRPDLRTLRCPIVASNYGSNPDGTPSGVYAARGGDAGTGWNAYGNVTPTVWQFGSNINCPGASGATDVNAFRGSLAELRTLLTGTQEDDMPLTDAEKDDIALRTMRAVLGATLGKSTTTVAQVLQGLNATIAKEGTNPTELAAALAGLPQPQPVDTAALAAALAAALPPDTAGAVDVDRLAAAVAAELAARLAE